MQKRMTPYSYFAELSPAGKSSSPENIQQKINQAVNNIREQAPEPKIVYVDKPYPVEVPKPVEMGNPDGNNGKTPWGLIILFGIIGMVTVGMVTVGIVAIISGGKK